MLASNSDAQNGGYAAKREFVGNSGYSRETCYFDLLWVISVYFGLFLVILGYFGLFFILSDHHFTRFQVLALILR